MRGFAQSIVETVRHPLLILDADLRVREANAAFYRTFKVTGTETEGRLIYELGGGSGTSHGCGRCWRRSIGMGDRSRTLRSGTTSRTSGSR